MKECNNMEDKEKIWHKVESVQERIWRQDDGIDRNLVHVQLIGIFRLKLF